MLSRVARSTAQRSGSSLARMAPANRVAMISQHLSTSAPACSAPTPIPTPEGPSDVVKFEAIHSLRKLTLNRPKALNAITREMTDLITPQLAKWEASPLANVVVLKGVGKHFCAGGDVVTLVKQLDNEADWTKSAEFFQSEYTMNAFLANMKTPVVSIMHGTTLGGGVGLSMHAPFRIATDTTLLGMPETNIGLFPDVGANFFLSRLDGQLGVYLGLTGHFLKGKSAFLAGFASHYVPSDRIEALETRLSELDQKASAADINAAIEEFAADSEELASGPAYELAGVTRRAIDVIFARKTVEEIVRDLKALEQGELNLKKIAIEGQTNDISALQRWAQETRETLEKRSPTSLKLTLRAIREGAKLDIDEVFVMDTRIGTACCNPVVHPDFKVGVTHSLINKNRTERAPWSPATLEEVSDSSIQNIFFSNPPPFKNPPLPRLSYLHKSHPYREYPHAGFSLPTEKLIKDIVTGDAKGSGQYAVTKADVLKTLKKRWNGKVGLKEKVDEVLARKCQVSEEGQTLKWVY